MSTLPTIPPEAVMPSGSLRVPVHKGEKYLADYRAGWRASGNAWRGGENGPWHDGTSSRAYDDGYLDRASRDDQKWHLSWCTAHHNHEGGCGRA